MSRESVVLVAALTMVAAVFLAFASPAAVGPGAPATAVPPLSELVHGDFISGPPGEVFPEPEWYETLTDWRWLRDKLCPPERIHGGI